MGNKAIIKEKVRNEDTLLPSSNEKDIPRRGDIYIYNKPKADRSEERLSFDFYSLLSNKKSVFFDPSSDEIFSLHVDPIGPYVKTDRNGVYYVKGTNFLLNSALGMIYYIQFVNGESHEKYYGKSRFYSDYDDYLLLSKEGDVIRRNSKKDSHPKQEFKSLGIEEFWTGHNNHFVIVERDDSDPDFKGEQFIYRIYVDDKLVGTYSNIEQYRYAEIYEKDGTKLFSLDNHLYQHPNTKYNETDVLRIEIDMDRVLGD